ncbi:hypothetical protein KKB43_05400 [Patescibacteria group bacterium]|nr:hypothetical protein [Patescibacteria group bacterium]
MKKILNIISVIVMLILFVLSIVLFGQNKNLSEKINVLNGTIADLEKQKQELESKPPIGWNTYTNKKYKFRMWYPEKVTDKFMGTFDIGGNEYYSDSEKYYNIFFVYAIPDEGSPSQVIDIYIYNSNLDIKEFIKNDTKKHQPDVMKKYSDSEIISGIQQVKSDSINLYRFENKGDYYLKKDDLIVTFMSRGEDYIDNYQQIYETMVKSFRFIE